jgi:predicted PhzF superfamily epimerase YddE/YHI9
VQVRSYHLLNVFTGADDAFGNPLGVFLGGEPVPESERQRVAGDLGYSETVFVTDADSGEMRIHTPATELPLAGHPLVGTAWLIARELGKCELLRPPAGEVETWQDGDMRWIRARPEWAPVIEFRRYDTPEEVNGLEGAPDGLGFADCWAWIDEPGGVVRARVFVEEEGIPEDEATGAAALRMGALLGRAIEIRQGEGSVLHARPGTDGMVEVGGRVRYIGERSYG